MSYLKIAENEFIKAKASFRDRISSFFPNANFDSLAENYLPGENINLDYAMSEINSAKTSVELNKLKINFQEKDNFDVTQIKKELLKLYTQEEILNDKLEHLIIKAPFSGVILTEGIEHMANKYVMEGTKLFELANLNTWNAVLFVKENDIHSIKLDNKVKVELVAFKSTTEAQIYSASIVSIGAEKIANDNHYSFFAGLYRVTVRLIPENNQITNPSKFKFEYKVNGEIVTDSGKIINLLFKYFKQLI